MKIVVYQAQSGNKRIRMIGEAMAAGFKRHSLQVIRPKKFDGKILGDLVTAYGWVHENVFKAYRKAGAHYAYWDLGYWGRSIQYGYHRVGVDDWDSVTHCLRGCPSQRFDAWKFDVAEFSAKRTQRAREVLVAGMSKKAARTHGYGFNRWENAAKDSIESFNLPYLLNLRPKPNKQIRGLEPLADALNRSRIVVSHHSNVAIDALFAGVPSYCVKGMGLLSSQKELTREVIENPYFPTRSEQLQILYDTAHCQWSINEMRSGAAAAYIMDVLRSM